MITVLETGSWTITATETFILSIENQESDTPQLQTIVEVKPIAAGSMSLAKSSAPVSDILASAANVNWFDFPSMPVAIAYENLVTGAKAIKATITSGTWAINIRRGMD